MVGPENPDLAEVRHWLADVPSSTSDFMEAAVGSAEPRALDGMPVHYTNDGGQFDAGAPWANNVNDATPRPPFFIDPDAGVFVPLKRGVAVQFGEERPEWSAAVELPQGEEYFLVTPETVTIRLLEKIGEERLEDSFAMQVAMARLADRFLYHRDLLHTERPPVQNRRIFYGKAARHLAAVSRKKGGKGNFIFHLCFMSFLATGRASSFFLCGESPIGSLLAIPANVSCI
jgi:hypothetical protein